MTYVTIESGVHANTQTGELFDLVQEVDGEVTDRPVLTEEQLLEQLIRLNKELNARKEDIAQLIKDNKYHKKNRPQGIPADVCKKTAKTAVRYAASDYEEKKIESLEFFAFYEQATGYND